MAHRNRWGVALALALVGLMVSVALAYSWDPPRTTAKNKGRLGPNYTWDNGDPVLAINGDGSLSAAYVSDYTKGTYACDGSGTYLSNFYTRSTDGGKTWQKAKRLNGKFHADRVTLTNAGSNVVTFYARQTKYYGCPGGSTLDTAKPRYIYARTNTSNGSLSGWTAAQKLPGQTKKSRGDYLWAASDGSLVVVVTTNTANGNIWLWRSTNSGVSFSGPVTVGATTATDTVSGYVGGFSGLPAVAVHGSTVVVGWVNTPGGEIVAAVSTNSGASFGGTTTLQASGGNENNGYLQADDKTGDNRMVFTWTTAAGAYLRIFDDGTDSWLTKRTIVTFPDADAAVGSTFNKGGEGATVALGPSSTIGVALSECNTTGGSTCNDPDLLNVKARSQLVWRESTNNGAAWGAAEIVGPVKKSKSSYLNNYGDVIYLADGRPFILWNGHNSVYSAYNMQIRVGN